MIRSPAMRCWNPVVGRLFDTRKHVRLGFLFLMTLLSLSVLVTASDVTANDDSALLERIIANWKNREQRVSAATFTWSHVRDDIAGWSSYQAAWRAAAEVQNDSMQLGTASFRYDSMRFQHHVRLEFSGFNVDPRVSESPIDVFPFGRLHFDPTINSAFLSAQAGHFQEERFTWGKPRLMQSFFDGRERIDLFTQNETQYAEAMIMSGADYGYDLFGDLDSIFFRPFLLTFRPFASCGQNIDVRTLRVAHNDTVDAAGNVILEELLPSGRLRTYWIDPSRDFTVVRFLSRDTKQRAMLQMEYRLDTTLGWVPDNWTGTVFPGFQPSPGRNLLPHLYSGKLEECSLDSQADNTAMPSPLPVGTFVTNVNRNLHYILRPDGSKRMIRRDELRDPTIGYAELARSSAIQAPQPPRPRMSNSKTMLIVGGAMATMTFWLWHRKSTRQLVP